MVPFDVPDPDLEKTAKRNGLDTSAAGWRSSNAREVSSAFGLTVGDHLSRQSPGPATVATAGDSVLAAPEVDSTI